MLESLATSAVSVGKHSLTAHPLHSIRRFTLETNLMNAANVGKPSAREAGSRDIRGFIQERNPLNAAFVGKCSVLNHQLFSINDAMPNRE